MTDIVSSCLGLLQLVFDAIALAGAIRFMTGMEALTGFVLITWSASFTFLEMQKFWKNDYSCQGGRKGRPGGLPGVVTCYRV